MKEKKNILLLIALILGGAYLVYSLVYWSGAVGSSTGAKAAGAAIASALVMPHYVCVVVAVVFNALAFFMRKATFALVAGILYAVSMVLFPMYFYFVLVEMILCFVAFAKMRKLEQQA